MTIEVLPIVQGDWVATITDGVPEIGRVKLSWREPSGEVLMNIVLYAPTGAVIGRQSPACGGPKTFEPAVPFDERWQRIEKPRFPLRRVDVQRPSEGKPGWFTWVWTYYHSDADSALNTKPVRTTPKKQSSDRPRGSVRVIYVDRPHKNLNEDLEATALRRAASELRDASRLLGAESASLLRSRAKALETEADRIKPPGA